MFRNPLSSIKKASLGFAFGTAVGSVIALGTLPEGLNNSQQSQYVRSFGSIGGLTGLIVDSITGATTTCIASYKRRKHQSFNRSLIDCNVTPQVFLQEYIKLAYSDTPELNLEYQDKTWLIQKVIPQVLRVIPKEKRYCPEYMETLLEDLYSFLREEVYNYVNVGIGQPILLIQRLLNPEKEERIAKSISERLLNLYNNNVVHNQKSPTLEEDQQPRALEEGQQLRALEEGQPAVEIPLNPTVERIISQDESQGQ